MGEPFPVFRVGYLPYRYLKRDLYDVVQHAPLLPTDFVEAAEYPAGTTRTLPDGRESTVEDICDFIIEYINSDVLVSAAPDIWTLFAELIEGAPLRSTSCHSW